MQHNRVEHLKISSGHLSNICILGNVKYRNAPEFESANFIGTSVNTANIDSP
jgi:hypothetical protein